MIFKFTCPYCGVEQSREIRSDLRPVVNDEPFYGVDVITCGMLSINKGCGKQFVLDYWVEPKTEVRKIEGE